VYKCVVCDASFDSKQSLAAHCKIHKDVEFAELHVRLPKEKVEAFKQFCESHNSTTCHMVLTMIDAYTEGVKKGLIVIGGANPAIVHLQQFFNARPRGRGKYDVEALAADPLREILFCDHLHHRDNALGQLGWCTECKRWVTPAICQSCVVR
jgi:hypothetical protein